MNEKEKLKKLKESIQHIAYPYYYTDLGNRYSFKETDGSVSVGSTIEKQNNGKVKVLSRNINSDCVNGVCPIK